jgi:hypothetical protein
MMPKHTLLAVLVACTWCMASSAYATNTDGQTQGGNHGAQSSQSASSGHLFGDHTGSGQSTGNTVPSPHASGSGSGSAGSCDPGSNGAGMGPHVPSCNSTGGSGSDNSPSSPSWQSLLPGSIQ